MCSTAADVTAVVYSTGPACLTDPPCSSGCADHTAIAETGCGWCGDPIGYDAGYRYGANGIELFHAEPCFAEVHHDRPAPVQTAGERAADMDEALL